jgi:predicted  nucleic acid-binding Zn-ribbon protein
MACMEHACTKCDFAAFNNVPRMHSCPKCGGPVQSFFDEDPADDDRDIDSDDVEDEPEEEDE